MSDIEHRTAARNSAAHNPNNRRIRELSKYARESFPDGGGDYVLPDTPVGHHLAIALLTHLACSAPRNSRWLPDFCAARAPWLDPDEIDLIKLRPDKAQVLGNKLRLTAALRDKLGFTSIAPCDQTPEQRAVLRKEKNRKAERERRRRNREAKGGQTRTEWLAANSTSKEKPWEALGMSRRDCYRKRKRELGTGTVDTCLPSVLSTQPVPRGTLRARVPLRSDNKPALKLARRRGLRGAHAAHHGS